MARTLRPLSLGQILDETFDIYRNHFVLFVSISALPNLIVLAIDLGARLSVSTDLFKSLALLLISFFASSLVTAATTIGISDIYLDMPTTAITCFSRVSNKILRVLLVSFLFGLIVVIGCSVFVIPGIYLAGVFGLAVPVVVLEGISVGESFNRSKALTKDSVGRVIIVVFFLAIVIAFIMATALQTAWSMIISILHIRTLSSGVWYVVISTLTTILFGPISSIALTLTYYDQRIRREAFDICHMMSLMNKTAANLETQK